MLGATEEGVEEDCTWDGLDRPLYTYIGETQVDVVGNQRTKRRFFLEASIPDQCSLARQHRIVCNDTRT